MIFIILYVFPGLTGVGRTLKVNATLHLAYLVSQSQPKSTQLCSNTVIIGWSHTDTHTRDMPGLNEYPQCPLLGTKKRTL